MDGTILNEQGSIEWTHLAVYAGKAVRCVEFSTPVGAMWLVEGRGTVSHHRSAFDYGIWPLSDELKGLGLGLHIKCSICGELLKQPGSLLLYIGPPDEHGVFTGTKEHACIDCKPKKGPPSKPGYLTKEDMNKERERLLNTDFSVRLKEDGWTHMAEVDGKYARCRIEPSTGHWEVEGHEGKRVTLKQVSPL